MTEARLMCATPGCGRFLLIDPRHFANLTAAGWTCAEHDKQDRRATCHAVTDDAASTRSRPWRNSR